ncbi:Uncharacterised protein [Raoultella planticola]|nr:Uncharacterised protein [Raoultella planticola]
MSSLSIRLFTLFREEHPVRDALVLFTITLLLHFFGAMLRLVQELSFFLAAECRDGRDLRPLCLAQS